MDARKSCSSHISKPIYRPRVSEKKSRMTQFKWQNCFPGEHLVGEVEREKPQLIDRRRAPLVVITLPFSPPRS